MRVAGLFRSMLSILFPEERLEDRIKIDGDAVEIWGSPFSKRVVYHGKNFYFSAIRDIDEDKDGIVIKGIKMESYPTELYNRYAYVELKITKDGKTYYRFIEF